MGVTRATANAIGKSLGFAAKRPVATLGATTSGYVGYQAYPVVKAVWDFGKTYIAPIANTLNKALGGKWGSLLVGASLLTIAAIALKKTKDLVRKATKKALLAFAGIATAVIGYNYMFNKSSEATESSTALPENRATVDVTTNLFKGIKNQFSNTPSLAEMGSSLRGAFRSVVDSTITKVLPIPFAAAAAKDGLPNILGRAPATTSVAPDAPKAQDVDTAPTTRTTTDAPVRATTPDVLETPRLPNLPEVQGRSPIFVIGDPKLETPAIDGDSPKLPNVIDTPPNVSGVPTGPTTAFASGAGTNVITEAADETSGLLQRLTKIKNASKAIYGYRLTQHAPMAGNAILLGGVTYGISELIQEVAKEQRALIESYGPEENGGNGTISADGVQDYLDFNKKTENALYADLTAGAIDPSGAAISYSVFVDVRAHNQFQNWVDKNEGGLPPEVINAASMSLIVPDTIQQSMFDDVKHRIPLSLEKADPALKKAILARQHLAEIGRNNPAPISPIMGTPVQMEYHNQQYQAWDAEVRPAREALYAEVRNLLQEPAGANAYLNLMTPSERLDIVERFAKSDDQTNLEQNHPLVAAHLEAENQGNFLHRIFNTHDATKALTDPKTTAMNDYIIGRLGLGGTPPTSTPSTPASDLIASVSTPKGLVPSAY